MLSWLYLMIIWIIWIIPQHRIPQYVYLASQRSFVAGRTSPFLFWQRSSARSPAADSGEHRRRSSWPWTVAECSGWHHGISWHPDAVTMTGWYCKNDQLDVENAWEKDWNWLGTQANMVKYCQIRSNWSWKHNWNKVKDWQHVFHYVVQGQVMSSSELTLANDLNLWVSGHPNNWSQGEAFEFQQIGPQQPVHLHSNSMCTRYDWHVAFWKNGTTVQPFFWVGQNPVLCNFLK